MKASIQTKVRLRTVPLFTAALLAWSASYAESLPLWEVGTGVATINLPDYRGADETSTYILPIPYLVYRGEFLKADREGVRGTLFASERAEINVSINATPPATSKHNTARRGMPDLKPTFEVGPTLDIKLWRSHDAKARLRFRAPVRAGITAETSPRQIGWLFSPNLNLDIEDTPGMPGWNLGLVAGTLFSNRKYNAHFYSVAPQQATAGRPAYAASGGYSGAQLTMTISKRFARHWVGGFVRYDTVSGAVFEDSPLVRKRHAVLAGIALVWVFGESSTMVDVPDFTVR
ncbi:MAG TPA: MipA/OmpV family protein [Burkholderiaceae bacterium]|nr:MipA/OmpV family protein [Burkholderiaceae bacterium]